MKWAPDGKKAITREDGKFTICRSPQHGFVRPGGKIVFQLIDMRSHECIAIDRDVEDTPDTIVSVIRRFKDIADNA